MGAVVFCAWFGGVALLLWARGGDSRDPERTRRDNWTAVVVGIVFEAVGLLLLTSTHRIGVVVFSALLAGVGNLIWLAALLAMGLSALPPAPWHRNRP